MNSIMQRLLGHGATRTLSGFVPGLESRWLVDLVKQQARDVHFDILVGKSQLMLLTE
jgi:hypothetical protein